LVLEAHLLVQTVEILLLQLQMLVTFSLLEEVPEDNQQETLEDRGAEAQVGALEDQVTLVVFHHPKETLAVTATLEPKVEEAEEQEAPELMQLKMVEMVALEQCQILLEAQSDFVAEALEAATEGNFLMDHLGAQVAAQEIHLELTDLVVALVEINNLFLVHLQVEVEELY
tara:strand:- start:137 stop:649 length:513 start_codon:yes stop_codon:yes gene_type:complete